MSLLFRAICLLIVGLCIGSFLNVIIYRLPIMLNRKWRNECIEVLGDECTLSPMMRLDLIWCIHIHIVRNVRLRFLCGQIFL